MTGMGEFLGGFMVRTLNCHCWGLGWIPGWGIRIPQTAWHAKKQTRKDSNGKFYVIYILCTCMLSHFSHVELFATLWIVACHTPLSIGFSRQEYWIGKPCPPSRGSLQPRNQTCVSCIAGRFFIIWSTREAHKTVKTSSKFMYVTILHFACYIISLPESGQLHATISL